MTKPYEDIPTQGKHRGDASKLESGMNVRAPKPPDPAQTSNKPVHRTHQFMHDEKKGLYRFRLWTTEAIDEPPEGYRELGRYRADDLDEAFKKLPDEPRYVVFENTETGEVFYDSERNLSGSWTEEGRFDQVTVFEEEPDAAAYAAARHDALEGGTR